MADNIDAIPAGPELDRPVAEKVMGPMSRLSLAKNDGWWIAARDESEWERFQPSTNMAHAWEVVEKLRERYGVRVDAVRNNVVLCLVGDKEFGDVAMGSADTASLAICRAALKAVAQ